MYNLKNKELSILSSSIKTVFVIKVSCNLFVPMNMSRDKEDNDAGLSERTQKQIDELPKHAQGIYKEAHKNALERYQDPDKRRNSNESAEEVAHKVAWVAVKNEYEKKGDKSVKKADD